MNRPGKAQVKVPGHKEPTVIRSTRQREVIRGVLEKADRPLLPAEVLSQGQLKHPTLGIATVYRTLADLTREGFLREVKLPGENTRYERAASAHHHFFQCNGCGKVFELIGCVPGLENLLPKGFVMSGHDITIYGLCMDCRTGAGRSPAKASMPRQGKP
jgi:Fur family ferric uptake transcriptional regulator